MLLFCVCAWLSLCLSQSISVCVYVYCGMPLNSTNKYIQTYTPTRTQLRARVRVAKLDRRSIGQDYRKVVNVKYIVNRLCKIYPNCKLLNNNNNSY